MPETPDDFQGAVPEIEGRLQMRSIGMNDLVTRTIDDIRYQRRMGLPWGPSVDHLRNIVTGIEDPEFWDGIPDRLREKLTEWEASEDPKLRRRAKKLRQEYRQHGWNGISIRAKKGPDGRPRYRPTDDDLSRMFSILLRLLARRKATWKVRQASALPDPPDLSELQDHG